jgi:hypothetical protein
MKKRVVVLSIATCLGCASVPLDAQAQYTCNSNTTTCYYWAQLGNYDAIAGSAGSGAGVVGSATTGYGVYAQSNGLDSYAVYATAAGVGSTGVYAQSPVLGVYGGPGSTSERGMWRSRVTL